MQRLTRSVPQKFRSLAKKHKKQINIRLNTRSVILILPSLEAVELEWFIQMFGGIMPLAVAE